VNALGSCSETRIHRLALQGQDAEDALVDAAQGLAADEAFQPLDPEGEFPQGQRTLAGEAARAQALQVFRQSVFGPVDDPEVLLPPALEGRLGEAPAATGEEGEGLDHHPLAALGGQLLPPGDRLGFTAGVAQVDGPPGRGKEQVRIGPARFRQNLHVPGVVLVHVDGAL
jgi:hypothetical protein